MMLLLSRGKNIGSLWIGTYFQTHAEAILSRLEAALDLIRTHDPHRFNRIGRDLDRVWVRLIPGTIGHFDASLRACVLDERFVLADTTTPQMIAAVIVHEATHARLWECGVGYDEQMRQRVEQVCLRRELAFVKRLSDGGRAGAWVEQAIALPDATWSNASLQATELDGNVQTLQHLGYPNWLIRTILTVRRWRARGSPSP